MVGLQPQVCALVVHTNTVAKVERDPCSLQCLYITVYTADTPPGGVAQEGRQKFIPNYE